MYTVSLMLRRVGHKKSDGFWRPKAELGFTSHELTLRPIRRVTIFPQSGPSRRSVWISGSGMNQRNAVNRQRQTATGSDRQANRSPFVAFDRQTRHTMSLKGGSCKNVCKSISRCMQDQCQCQCQCQCDCGCDCFNTISLLYRSRY